MLILWRVESLTCCFVHPSVRPFLAMTTLSRSQTWRSIAWLGAILALSIPRPALAQSSTGFTVETIGEGIHALIRTDPPGLMFEANAAFIVGRDDVVVIDGGSNPASALAVMAAVRRATPKPVRWVINTHWHDDHMMGNAVWRDTFPDVRFIAHATAGQDLATDGAANRRQMMEQGPQYVTFLRQQLEQGKGLDGQPITPDEQASHRSSIALAEHFFAQARSFRPIAPDLGFDTRLVLDHGGRTIELQYLGRAHTRGDIVVHLPAEGMLFVGDLISAPTPLIGSTSFPLEYGATLERVLALPHRVIVPGHGPVMRDDRYAQRMVRLLAAIATQTTAAVARGETLAATRRSVDLSAFRREFAGDSRLLALLFDNYVAGPAVARAHEAARSAAR